MGTKHAVLIAFGGAAAVAFAQLLTAPLVTPGAQDHSANLRTVLSNAPSAFHRGLVLSNHTVNVLARLRGTEPGAVKVTKRGTNSTSPFEIEVAKTADAQSEAAALSRDFGLGAAVVLDEVAADGRHRTNFVFRNGIADKRIAPANLKDLAPGARRLTIRPEGSAPSAPQTVRVGQ